MDKLSYALGLSIGQQLIEMGMKGKMVVADYAAAIADSLEGRDLQMEGAEAQQILNEFFN